MCVGKTVFRDNVILPDLHDILSNAVRANVVGSEDVATAPCCICQIVLKVQLHNPGKRRSGQNVPRLAHCSKILEDTCGGN